MNDPGLSPLLERLERIEAMLVVLVERQTI
jgi:hypothetical protein